MIILIAAISTNNCIGAQGDLPWHIPEDLQHFKRMTTGHVVLMGRKTWESIPEKIRPLPNRKNIVITRQHDYPLPEGVELYHSVEDAIAAHVNETIMVTGGGDIYTQTIHRADKLYITHVDKHVDGDAFFPSIDQTMWKETERDDREGFSFVTYERR